VYEAQAVAAAANVFVKMSLALQIPLSPHLLRADAIRLAFADLLLFQSWTAMKHAIAIKFIHFFIQTAEKVVVAKSLYFQTIAAGQLFWAFDAICSYSPSLRVYAR